MTGKDATVVIHDGESGVQIGIVTEHVLDDIILELIIQEQRVVGLEEDIGTVLVLSVLSDVTGHLTTLEGSLTHLTVTITTHLEVGTQRIDGFHAHTIQSYRLLECLRVILTARIQYRHCLDHFSLGDATAVVTHSNT